LENKQARQLVLVDKTAIFFLVTSISSLTAWNLLEYFKEFDANTIFAFRFISICFFLYSSYKLLIDFKFESKYFKNIFYLFILYECITVIRVWPFSFDELINLFQAPYIFWPFVIPLFVFFDKRIPTLLLLTKWIYRLGLFFLLLVVVYPSLLLDRILAQNVIATFAYGCGFLLLIANYLSNKKVNISFLVIFLGAISLTYLARRNGMFTLGAFIISGYFLNALNKSRTAFFRVFPLIIGIGVLLFFIFDNFSSALTKELEQRITKDSRSEIFKMYFLEINNFMVFGKGMNGTYYFPSGVNDDGSIIDVDERNVVENGYLQLMLSGGIVHIVLFLLVMLPAAINGIFKSSNQFTKACSVMILLWLLDMIIFGLPGLSLHYVLVWICVGICYKPSIRNKKDHELKAKFRKLDLI